MTHLKVDRWSDGPDSGWRPELEEALGRGQVLEPVLAKIPQRYAGQHACLIDTTTCPPCAAEQIRASLCTAMPT
jgi:hypothetical protein